MTVDTYTRAAELVEVIDGDTAVLLVDLGWYVHVRMSCRLAGLNAPEHNAPGGQGAKAELARLLDLGPITVQSTSADKYAGRFDGLLWVATKAGPLAVNDHLVAGGWAAAWDGHGTRPVPPYPRVPLS